MATIIIPRRHLAQPQGRAVVDESIWPRHQIFLPSLGYTGIIGGVETLSLPSANTPFSRVGPAGREHAWRPNSGTLPGESHGWVAGNFDVGSDASMLFVGSRIDDFFWGGVAYGGSSWGLWVGFNSSSAVAAYVDNPTSASYTATLSGAGGVTHAVGLTKRGNVVKIFADGRVASATGGNGGIRRSAGSGIFGQSAMVDGRAVYAATPLAAICSVALSDDAMLTLLDNPWRIFRADPIRIYSLPSGPITLNSLIMGTFTQTTARATIGLTR